MADRHDFVIIGAGPAGEAAAYKARHVRLNRVVALKMILAGDRASPEDLFRFLHEAGDLGGQTWRHLVHAPDVWGAARAGERRGQRIIMADRRRRA